MKRWLSCSEWSTPLEDALRRLPAGEGVGVEQGTTGVAAVRVVDGELQRHPGARSCGDIVAVRVAVGGVELRWVSETSDGSARRCEIVEDTGADDGREEVVALLPALRVLWGAVSERRDGWARLTDTRIGSLWIPVPLDVALGQHLAFETQEVVIELSGTTPGGADMTGNRAVIEELLTGKVIVAEERS